MKVGSYSERGVVNALFYSLSASDPTGAEKFVEQLMGKVYWGKRCAAETDFSGVHKTFIEPSLSNFGDPDAMLMFSGDGDTKRLVFMEAKRDDCQLETAWREFHDGLAANPPECRPRGDIFKQLYYKVRFSETLKTGPIPADGLPFDPPFCRRARRRKNGDLQTYGTRMIGNRTVVMKIVQEVAEYAKESFFVALIAQQLDAPLKALWEQVTSDWAGHGMPRDWSTSNWGVLSWRDVYCLARQASLQHFCDVFDFNQAQILGETRPPDPV